MKTGAYRVNTGLSYVAGEKERYVEAGAVVDDIPEKSIHWLVKQGHIEATDEKPTKVKK